MAAPSKQSSRWGSFLQQAVAGVESRLDNILAEQDENAPPAKNPASTKPAAAAATKSEGPSRSASASNRTNDRLQERLARAIAAKNTAAQKAEKGDASAPPSATPSRTGSPATIADSPRASTDTEPVTDTNDGNDVSIAKPQSDETQTLQVPSIEGLSAAALPEPTVVEQPKGDNQDMNGLAPKPEGEASPRPSAESTRSSMPRASTDSTRHTSGARSSSDIQTNDPSGITLQLKNSEDYDVLKQLQSDFEKSELQRQEEVHGYIERIDALQSKLQYLAKESTDAARNASGAAPAGSLEKRLADKEEQIGLLMEEGQKLSKKELNHLATIKKLRAKVQEDGKELAEATKKQEKAVADATLAMDRLKRAQNKEKRLVEKEKQVAQLQQDIDSLKSDRDAKDSTITELKRQLDEAATQEKEAEAKLVHESLEAEKKRVSDLEEELSNLKIEKDLVSDRAQAQLKQLREKMEKDSEHTRMAELEMKTEQQMLESKLEVMRARAEEVSSGTGGDAQAKLLRQIETLQTQYAVASDNWQGIEASLIARATNLEKERDEAARREADIRKKARAVTLKAKLNEDELEASKSTMPILQQELVDHKSKLDTLQQRVAVAESTLAEARATFEREKQSWQAELLRRVEEERAKWQEEAGSPGHLRAESPVTSTRRGLTTEFLGLQNLQLRRASARSVNSDAPAVEGILARRLSSQPPGPISGHGTPTRQDSTQSFKGNGEVPDAPSIFTDQDDFFENNVSVASPHQTINDMVSVSTAGAGPSVQLMERMSSAVRRLESEKAATKDDITRLSAQRDEARAEIVSLMRELQVKRDADKRVAELEDQVKDINSRYETTLEMLGEKSELVDELKSDIDDIKAMYRELVERTIK
ncbi:uncharacterized protein BP5553_02002 [Venustampulla echinocandica]|uniref:TATA element modulatory factor 1 TATA binding domain-containing protein n=1 Tax=Venustampulla echinocandica TaxID=2656787 RepID=A0A370U2T4_9HELO|nr:uncharacterized protein BP5553_02002 [Venustampulla echinocandica]RDL42023.1 hypothetical protein BP5553_02002 [Venustampulla echinocandica]